MGVPVREVVFKDCRFDGGVPQWYFRSDRKEEYWFRMAPDAPVLENTLGKGTTEALMLGEGFERSDIEIHQCEFVNAHDLLLVASNMHFHHNWIDNLHDEGMMLDAQPSASGLIHDNVITRCLSPISTALQGRTAGQWRIYRNLIDIRQPTAGFRPRRPGDTAIWRFGSLFKSNDDLAPDGPCDLFHNTFLVHNGLKAQASYLHYRTARSPHPFRSFNNVFVAVNPTPAEDQAIAFLPPPSFAGPTDGNLYHRFGPAAVPPFAHLNYTFRCVDHRSGSFKDLDELHAGKLFKQSRSQYAPGYEASGLIADPLFSDIRPDGIPAALDDLRLKAGSPARGAGVALPSELQALDDSRGETRLQPDRDIGCYRSGAEPLAVGVRGLRRFPAVGRT
jgi:hypothetical protein